VGVTPRHEVRAVARAIAEMQLAADAVDAAAAERFGVNRTDLALLGLLDSRGPLSAGELAAGLGLTPPSTTVAIQRLVEAGYVARTVDPVDRRRAIVEMTEAARDRIRAMYGPLGAEGAKELAEYSDEQLETIYRFLERSRRLQERHAARIRSGRPAADEATDTSGAG
jgi:DNA-binding MarR family transcriptional regulator